MDDLISRKALLEELQEAYDNAHRIFQNQNSPESQECCKLQLRTLHSVIKDVKEAPTINAVEVVRCKDCRNWGHGVPGEGEKVRVCVVSAEIETPFDGFCHKGERRDSDG